MGKKFARTAYMDFLIWGILSSMAMTVCTLVDALLVGNIVGSEGLAVSNLSTPVFLLYALIGITIGTGANIRIGRHLGADEIEDANKVFHSQLTLGVAVGLIVFALSVIFKPQILNFLGAKDQLFPLASNYLTVVFFSAPFFIIYHILSFSIRTDGNPQLAAIASAVVILVNMLLDVIFMSVFDWGILGASSSLCIAEILGTLILLLHFFKKSASLKIGFKIPSFKDVKSFVTGGFGVGSAYVFQALVMLVFNLLLMTYGDENGVLYVAIFGVIYTVSMIPFAIFDGASSAISTVVPIFAGEKDSDSILTVLKYGLVVVTLSGIGFCVIGNCFSGAIAHMFGLSGDFAIEIASRVIKLYSISFLFSGINTLMTAFWQTIDRNKFAAGMSGFRNFVFVIVIGSFLIPEYQIDGLGYTYLITEAICLIGVIIIYLVSGSKKYVKEKYAPSGRVYENYYPIGEGSVEQISKDLETIFGEWEIDKKQAFFMNLIIEELLLNINKYGMTEKHHKHYIAIKLLDHNGDYVLRIRDNVKNYNPFEANGDDVDNAFLQLISQKTKYSSYQRKLIFNYLYLVL